jgi:uncharacterized protein YkwD
MRRSIAWFAFATAVVFTAVSVAPEADADAAAVETALLQAINTGRASVGKPALVMHAGLRVKQQGHAQHMATIDALTHDGFGDRAQTAAPDPIEANGAPDDGYNGSVAENVAQNFRNGASDVDIANAIYQQWFNSPGHKANMFDENGFGYNAAGVGIFEEPDGKIWGALLLIVDGSPPGGGGTIDPPKKKRRCKRHPRRCRR